MCYSTSEFSASNAKRCRCHDTPQKRDLATKNRVKSRAQRKSIALFAKDTYGKNAYKAVMGARPRELAMIVSYMGQHDPEVAREMADVAGGDLPGTHNMVLSEVRSGKSQADIDKRGEVRTDPHMISQGMASVVAFESAYLGSGKHGDAVSAKSLADMKAGNALRSEAVELGLYDADLSPENMDSRQLRFYSVHTPEQIAQLGEAENAVERQFAQHAMDNVQFSPRPRGYLVPDKHLQSTPAELAETTTFKRRGYYPVRDGVHLVRNENYEPGTDEPEFIYRVDGDIELPANGSRPAVAETAKIVDIADISYDPATAPLGQESLYARTLSPDTPSGKRTRKQLAREMIQSAYLSERVPGVDAKMMNLSADEYASMGGRRPGHRPVGELFGTKTMTRPGKSKRVTLGTLTSTAQRKGVELGEHHSPYSTVAHGQLTQLREVDAWMNDYREDRLGMPKGHTATGVRYPRQRKSSAREAADGAFITTADGRRDEHAEVMQGLAKVRGRRKRAPKPTNTLTPHTLANTTLVPGKSTMSSADVDTMVSQANAIRSNTEGADQLDNNTEAAGTRLERTMGRFISSRRVEAKRGEAEGTVSVSSRTPIPSSLNAAHEFVPGRRFKPTGYVSAHSGANPKTGDGRTVKVVYETRSAMPVTGDRAVISPDSQFRIVSREERDGELIVHVADEDTVLEAAR